MNWKVVKEFFKPTSSKVIIFLLLLTGYLFLNYIGLVIIHETDQEFCFVLSRYSSYFYLLYVELKEGWINQTAYEEEGLKLEKERDAAVDEVIGKLSILRRFDPFLAVIALEKGKGHAGLAFVDFELNPLKIWGLPFYWYGLSCIIISICNKFRTRG